MLSARRADYTDFPKNTGKQTSGNDAGAFTEVKEKITTNWQKKFWTVILQLMRIKALSFFAFLPYYNSMPKKILILNGSPKKDGNTAAMVEWFSQGARSKGADVEIVRTAYLKYKTLGCISCRKCQTIDKYECCIDDDAKPVLVKMSEVDVIVMATPLYFF